MLVARWAKAGWTHLARRSLSNTGAPTAAAVDLGAGTRRGELVRLYSIFLGTSLTTGYPLAPGLGPACLLIALAIVARCLSFACPLRNKLRGRAALISGILAADDAENAASWLP